VRASRTSATIIDANRLVRVDTAIVAADTSRFTLSANSVENKVGAHAPVPRTQLSNEVHSLIPAPLPGARAPNRVLAALPRSAIVVDEWGPYDWRSPKLWPLDSAREGRLALAVLGPPGRWQVVASRGIARVSKHSGAIRALGVPDTIVVTPSDSSGPWDVTLEYRGGETIAPNGVPREAGTPVRLSYERFEPRIEWSARVFQWSDSTEPGFHQLAFEAMLRGTPLLELQPQHLDLMWYRPTMAGIPVAKWALEATGSVDLGPGTYTLRTISDDGVRVWVDGQLMIDDWAPHESAVDVAPLASGRHDLRVEYYQVDGWAELRVEIARGRPTSSRGSPGPH